MRNLTLGRLLALTVGLLVLLALACRGGSNAVDDTVREISDDELALMVLSLEDFGADFADFQLDEDSGLMTAEQKADDDFHPEDEAQDLLRFGWASGYEESDFDPEAIEEGSGLFFVSSGVDLFDTAEGAAGYFADLRAELSDLPGTTDEGATVGQVETFDADVADEAVGAHISISFEDGDGSFHSWAGALFFRRGRLMGSVFIGSFEQRQFEERLKGLARRMEERITSVLAGAAVSEGTLLTPQPTPTVPDADVEERDSGAAVSLLTTFNPFTLLGTVDGSQPSFPPTAQGVDDSLGAVLLEQGDLPPDFSLFGEFTFSTPSEFGAMEMVANMFVSGDAVGGDFGAMVMSAAIAVPEDAIDEFGDFGDLGVLTQADLDEIAGATDALGFGFSDFHLLDASGLGDGGFGMHIEMDFSGLLEAFEAPEEDNPFAGGIAMDMYGFLHGDRMSMVMVMWPVDGPPGVDSRALAETIDAKAAGI
ncbi:MAG: hypothetical protein ACE5IZ_11005 [Dehalococcoidia bacterium]